MMSKISNLFFISMIALSILGCGKTDVEYNAENAVNEHIENEVIVSSEISMESLKTAEESPKEDFVYEEFEGQVWIGEYIGDSEIVVIPDEIDGSPVIEISRTAFRNNETIKAVKIGNNVKIIRDQVFINCTALEYVIFGDSVETVEDNCFVGAYSLKEIYLNEGLLTIGELVFPDTEEPLIVPKSVTSIGDGAFGMPIQVYAGTYAEEFMKTYATYYDGYTYEVIE